MTADQGAGGQYASVADFAVVCHVRVDHEEVVAADARRPGLRGAAVDGDVLAEDVVIADLDAGGFAVVLEVLRAFAQDRAGVDDVAAAHFERATDGDLGPQDAGGADGDRPLD